MKTANKQITPLIIGGGALMLFLAIMFYGLFSGRTGLGNDPIPLIKVDRPVKIAPDGVHIRPEPHRDITVFDVFDENAANTEESSNLLQKIEEPTLSELNGAEKAPEMNLENIQKEPVQVQPIKQPPAKAKEAIKTPPSSSKKASINAGHYIQLAAFADATSAQENWNALQAKHQTLLANTPYVVQEWRDPNRNKLFYRLLVGPFNNKNKADDLCARLQKLSQNCFTRQLALQ